MEKERLMLSFGWIERFFSTKRNKHIRQSRFRIEFATKHLFSIIQAESQSNRRMFAVQNSNQNSTIEAPIKGINWKIRKSLNLSSFTVNVFYSE